MQNNKKNTPLSLQIEKQSKLGLGGLTIEEYIESKIEVANGRTKLQKQDENAFEDKVSNISYAPNFDKQAEMKQQDKDIAKVSQVLTDMPTRKQSATEIVTEVKSQIDRSILDSGDAFARVGRIVSDNIIYPMYNNAKQARQAADYNLIDAQTNVKGEKIGKSLGRILKPVIDKGKTHTNAFYTYLLDMHNIDRMNLDSNEAIQNVLAFEVENPSIAKIPREQLSQYAKKHEGKAEKVAEYLNLIEAAEKSKNKPVFGYKITAEISAQRAAARLAANPEFEELAQEVWRYNHNLQQYRVDTGLLSKEQAEKMNKIYPHYVPVYRVSQNAVAAHKPEMGSVRINQGIKSAIGGKDDILPLHEAMARQTMQTRQEGAKNLLGLRLLNNAKQNSERLSNIVTEIQDDKGLEYDIDADRTKMPEFENTFTVYQNGKPTTMGVSKDLYEGIKEISPKEKDFGFLINGTVGANTIFKKFVTAYNPAFIVRNFVRDIQDAGIYTKDLKSFTRNYPKALKSMQSNSKEWQQYQALGGFGSSFFDYERGFDISKIDKQMGTAEKLLKRIEDINFCVEQAPRFAEFLSTIERGGLEYENLMSAMYDAADITVNFGRSGKVGKFLNSTFVPFLNPSIQGYDKMIRTFTGARGARAWTMLAVRSAVLGVLPSLLNELMYGDYEEYEMLKDRDKDNNYIFKIGEDQWFKIPKGRVLSVLGGAAQRTTRMAKGGEDSWAGFISTTIDNVAPANPFSSHIFSPIMAVATNRTWYGSPIESQRLLNLPVVERYDESTDYFSKWLGKMLKCSPKKVSYLLDAYTGVLGDFVLPLISPKTKKIPFANAFIIDSTLSNDVGERFYNKLEKITLQSNSSALTEDERSIENLQERFLSKQSKAVSDLNKELRKIENSDKRNKDKLEEVKEIKLIIRGIQENALSVLPEYKIAVRKNIKSGKTDDDAYLYANKEIFGTEYALKTYNKDVYEKYSSSGMAAVSYFIAYFGTKGVEGVKENGETVPGSLKAAREKKLRELGLNREEIDKFMKTQYGYK